MSFRAVSPVEQRGIPLGKTQTLGERSAFLQQSFYSLMGFLAARLASRLGMTLLLFFYSLFKFRFFRLSYG